MTVIAGAAGLRPSDHLGSVHGPHSRHAGQHERQRCDEHDDQCGLPRREPAGALQRDRLCRRRRVHGAGQGHQALRGADQPGAAASTGGRSTRSSATSTRPTSRTCGRCARTGPRAAPPPSPCSTVSATGRGTTSSASPRRGTRRFSGSGPPCPTGPGRGRPTCGGPDPTTRRSCRPSSNGVTARGCWAARRKVGIIAGDRASDQLALNQYLLPDLKRIGVQPVVETIAAQTSETAATNSDASLDVEKLRAAGVDSLIPLMPFNAFLPVLGAQTQQQYFPKLLLSDYEDSIETSLGLLPAPVSEGAERAGRGDHRDAGRNRRFAARRRRAGTTPGCVPVGTPGTRPIPRPRRGT